MVTVQWPVLYRPLHYEACQFPSAKLLENCGMSKTFTQLFALTQKNMVTK